MARPLIPMRREAMLALRAAGWTYTQIAAALRCHHTTVMYACDDYYHDHKLRKAKRRRVCQ